MMRVLKKAEGNIYGALQALAEEKFLRLMRRNWRALDPCKLLRNYLRDANEGRAKLAAKILIKIGDNVEDILRLSTVELTWMLSTNFVKRKLRE